MVNPDKIFGRLGNRLFQMSYIYSQFRDGKIPNIYIQTSEYFEKYANDLKKWWGEDIGMIPEIAIHFRRAGNPSNLDEPRYEMNPFYINLSKTDYYEKAILEFPNKRFIVFSDDIPQAKEFFKGDIYKFSEGNDDIMDFNLMASCSGHIIANSSYSYWAALLSPNYGKVVAPKQWFSDGVQRVICPQNWTMI